MKNRILKIVAFVIAVILILGVAWFANALLGNPISQKIATNTAEKHLKENYGDKDFIIERVTYSFKDSKYHAFITSPGSIDSNFTLFIDMWGKLQSDSYEERVLSGWNTAERISSDYRNKVNSVFGSRIFPYEEHIGYGELIFVENKYINDPSLPEYTLISNDLTPNAFYDANEFGAKAGKITIHLYDKQVSYERLAEIILNVKRIFDDAGVKFHALDLVLEHPKEDSGIKPEGRVEVREFLYTDIYEEGLSDRVRTSDEEAKAYYNEQDKLKFK